jgi:phage FluMu gp28-like protein
VSILDAVEQGLVERIKKLDAPDPVARRDWLEELRASCPDVDTWREEYLCEPGSARSALLSYELIESCESNDSAAPQHWSADERSASSAPLLPVPFAPVHPGTPLFAGFDVGRKRDCSVLWVLERLGDVLHTRAVRVLERASFSAQEEMLHACMRDGRIKRLCVDATGIGAMLAERLRRAWGTRVEDVHFTLDVKSELVVPLLRTFELKQVRIPADAEVRADLHKIRKSVTASGHVRFDASRDENGHADRFWALALAHHASRQSAAGTIISLARKPAGW